MNREKITFGYAYDKSNPTFNPEPAYQEMFFRAQQNWLNDQLKSGKFLTVNDVVKAMGFEPMVRGMVYGWQSGDTVEFRLRRQEDPETIILEFEAYNIYKEMRPAEYHFTRDTAPVGVVCTLGHPANKCLVIKTNNGWRYVDGYAWVDPEDFRAGFDIYDPFKEN